MRPLRSAERERIANVERFVEEQQKLNERLERRMDQLEERLTTRMDRLEDKIENIGRFVQGLTITAIIGIATMTVAVVVFIYNVIKN